MERAASPHGRRRVPRAVRQAARAGQAAARALPGRVPEPGGADRRPRRPRRDPAHRAAERHRPRVPELHRQGPRRHAAPQRGDPAAPSSPSPLGLLGGDLAGLPQRPPGRSTTSSRSSCGRSRASPTRSSTATFTPDGAASAHDRGADARPPAATRPPSPTWEPARRLRHPELADRATRDARQQSCRASTWTDDQRAGPIGAPRTSEHARSRPHPEFVVLEIGGDVGALIVHTDARAARLEIEISASGHDGARSHKDVLERPMGGRAVHAAVFDGCARAPTRCGSTERRARARSPWRGAGRGARLDDLFLNGWGAGQAECPPPPLRPLATDRAPGRPV